MKYKRGAKLRAEVEKVKDKFLINLIALEEEITKAYENTPENDKFNLHNLNIALHDVKTMKELICNFYDVKESSIIAKNIVQNMLNFTSAEKQIFELVIKGHTVKYISKKLSKSSRTIENQLANMLKRICNDDLFSDFIRNSARFNEFQNMHYVMDTKGKDGEVIEHTKFRSPIKLLKFLYNSVISKNFII